MHSGKIKKAADNLRREGYSYSLIAEKLHISRATLSTWLADVPYTPNRKTIERIGAARAASGQAKKTEKDMSIREAELEALSFLGTVKERDRFMLGLGLYCAEGARGEVRYVNSEVGMINFMIRWFTDILDVPHEHIRIRLYIYPGKSLRECLMFWSKATGVPAKQFMKVQVDQRKRKGKSGGLTYGSAHLTVVAEGNKEYGVRLSRKLNAWRNAVITE